MAPKGFDHVMVHHEAGRNLKLARLTAAEQCAWVFGVLPIAGKARMRGAFMVGDDPATADDVAFQSGQSRKTAASLLVKMRALGMLEADETIGAEWVHDFEDHNPEPKKDRTSPARSKSYRERQKAKRHGVTVSSVTDASHRDGDGANGVVTPPEEEEEVEGTTEENAGVRPSVIHPDFDEVMAIVSDPELNLSVDEGAVSNACMSFRGEGADPIAAANKVAQMTREGHIRVRVASTLLSSVMGKQAEAAAKVKAAAEQPSRPAPFASSRRSSAADDLARRERAAREQLDREAAEQRGAA